MEVTQVRVGSGRRETIAAIRLLAGQMPFWSPVRQCQSSERQLIKHTHTHTILMDIFPGEPGLAGCPLNSPSPFILGLRILLGQT